MKVTFLIPPVLDGTADVDRCFGCNYSIYFLPLLPVLSAATVLKSQVNDIAIIDFPAHKKSKDEFMDYIRRDASDFFVFYTVFLSQNTDRMARDMIRKIRQNGVSFIFCGPQPTASPEVFLDKDDTFIIRGEPDFTVKEMLSCVMSKSDISTIKGISYVRDGNPVHNPSATFIPDLDLLPIPDRSLLDHAPYFNPKLRKMPHTALSASRGCYGRCWYCVPGSLAYARELNYKKECGSKPPARIHSAERVIKEFQEIARLGFKSVSVIDDEFLWGQDRTLAICSGIKDLKLEWFCLARSDKINDTVARAMAEAGCLYVDLGAESFDAEILDAVRKDMLPLDTQNAVKILKKYGIHVELNILFGATPKETVETIKNTLRMVKRLNPDYVLFSIANPFPGTDFYYAAKKEGWMVYGDYVPVDPSRNAIISYPHLSKQKLERLVSYAYFSFYFNPRYMLRQILSVRSFNDLVNKIKTALRFIKRNFF